MLAPVSIQTHDPNQMMTEDQVADLVCQSPRTLQKWRTTGQGPEFCKFGQSVRYRRNDVLLWIDQRRICHTSQPVPNGPRL